MSDYDARKNTAYFYENYSDIDVEFGKEVVRTTRLDTRQVLLRCSDSSWPCILYSASMRHAKIVAELKKSCLENIRNAKNYVSMRVVFHSGIDNRPISLIIQGKAAKFTRLDRQRPDTYVVTLNFTQKPPDDLINILGELLDIKRTARKRKDERIIITQEILPVLGLKEATCLAHIDGVPRKCLIHNLSVSGAGILIVGIAKFLLNKPAKLTLPFTGSGNPVVVAGTIVRDDSTESKKGVAMMSVQFEEKSIPLEYKIKIVAYLKKNPIPAQVV